MLTSLSYLTVRQRLELLAFVIVVAITLLFALHGPATKLDRLKSDGVLTVAIRNNASGYYEGPDGPAGPEYDLARAFADELGLRLRVVVPDSVAELLAMVREGRADFGAGALLDPALRGRFRLGPAYQQVSQQVVYRQGQPRPRSPEDLVGAGLVVTAGGPQARRLAELRAELPALSWEERGDVDTEELLYLVWQQEIPYTVANSNEVTLSRRFYPELQVAFELTEPQPLAWIFPAGKDRSLEQAAAEFFESLTQSGRLRQILDRYYGAARRLDYVGTRTFLRHIEERLPRYQELFERAAERYELDWRLLAAISYQESHWNPRARSPTGVRGMMMLTLRTAEQLGVDNRLDPEQSIIGGAQYYTIVKAKLPERIPEPDRTWMALAAYNVGFGHLEDARKITEMQGGDPDKWVDVARHLPLLSQRRWYTRTRHGYARGQEPVQYVQNIRSYYDILTWYAGKATRPGPRTRRGTPPYHVLPPAL